jgi:nicotinate-nucleotide--dimethylbenzimidazole phosphoribosyltransferase
MAKGPAMSREQAIKSIEAGIVVFENELKRGLDIVGVGDMGIGNTTPSSAVTAAITGESVEKVTGRGTGIDDKTFENKIKVIEEAIRLNKPDPKEPIDVLTKVGGFEIGGMTGIYLAGAANRVPVVVDGFISGAAALLAYGLEPKVKEYLIASHCSVEAGHKVILDWIGIDPLLNLNLRLGEGTGATFGINLVEAGCKILTQMATFADAGVSEKLED